MHDPSSHEAPALEGQQVGQQVGHVSEVERIPREPTPPQRPSMTSQQQQQQHQDQMYQEEVQRHVQQHEYESQQHEYESQHQDQMYQEYESQQHEHESQPNHHEPVPPPRTPEEEIKVIKRSWDNPAGNNEPAPPLLVTDDPFILLGAEYHPDLTFEDVRCAYKKRIKQYHPDRRAGPGATTEDREAANRDFARINAAYHLVEGSWDKILKKRQQNRGGTVGQRYRDGFWGHGRGVAVPGAEDDGGPGHGEVYKSDNENFRNGGRYRGGNGTGGSGGGESDFFATTQGGTQYVPTEGRGSLQNPHGKSQSTFFQSTIYSATVGETRHRNTNRVTVESNCHVTGKDYRPF